MGGCFYSLLPCRSLFNNDLTELPPGIFDSLSLLTFLCVPFGRGVVLHAEPLFCIVAFAYLSVGAQSGRHALSIGCGWLVYAAISLLSLSFIESLSQHLVSKSEFCAPLALGIIFKLNPDLLAVSIRHCLAGLWMKMNWQSCRTASLTRCLYWLSCTCLRKRRTLVC